MIGDRPGPCENSFGETQHQEPADHPDQQFIRRQRRATQPAGQKSALRSQTLDAEKVAGPYRFSSPSPVVAGSERSGLYGTVFPVGKASRVYFAAGWDYTDFSAVVTSGLRARWRASGSDVLQTLAMNWSLRESAKRWMYSRGRRLVRASLHPGKALRAVVRYMT